LTEGEIISAHPHITNEDIRAAQAFAADYLQKHPWIDYALRSRLTWTTNEHGEIAGVRVHDANFVELLTGDHLRLVVRRLSGERVEFVLTGVHDQRIDLWKAMIVSEVSAWPIASTPENVWHELFRDALREKKDERQQAARLIAKFPDAWLFAMESSYGGSVFALCESLEIFEA